MSSSEEERAVTYFGFLATFVCIPIAVALLLVLSRRARGTLLAGRPRGLPSPTLIVGMHMLVALVYTTPWDNYLVANGVWWYRPELVTGITIWWVPIEEYCFFVLQALLAGLVLLLVWRPRPAGTPAAASNTPRWAISLTLAALWLAAAAILVVGWQRGTYLGLQLTWALPPLILQAAVGGDILWARRRVVLGTIVGLTAYLAATDALAIESGTWTIDPAQSLHILVAGALPLEELTFFLITNVLLVCGMTLMHSPETYSRLPVRCASEGQPGPSAAGPYSPPGTDRR